MRITGGELRSRRIETGALKGARPTTDRVRESLFNILDHAVELEDAYVLDVFAGSGIISFECISRGVAKSCAVEKHRGNARSIVRNADVLGISAQLQVLTKDAAKVTVEDIPDKLTFAYVDPPYNNAVLDKTLLALAELHWQEEHIIVVEHSPQHFYSVPNSLELTQRRDYGDTSLSFFVVS